MQSPIVTDSPMRTLDPTRTFGRLRDAYFRYYNTPFGLDDQRLQQERTNLLDRDGGVYRLPLLELRPEYVSAPHSLLDSVKAAGAAEELAAFVEAGMIPPGRPLYRHQEDALEIGMATGRHAVITAGTGSGKTESFLLPVIASLLDESRSWAGSPAQPASDWWSSDDEPFRSQREGRRDAPRPCVLWSSIR